MARSVACFFVFKFPSWIPCEGASSPSGSDPVRPAGRLGASARTGLGVPWCHTVARSIMRTTGNTLRHGENLADSDGQGRNLNFRNTFLWRVLIFK